jgi:integrase/recombinase XerD
MRPIEWQKYPLVAALPSARTWLQLVADLGRSGNTVAAYGRGLNAFLHFCAERAQDLDTGLPVRLAPERAGRGHIAQWVNQLLGRAAPIGTGVIHLDSGGAIANATLQQRLTAVRLWFDHPVEEGLRKSNPVGRGKYSRRGLHQPSRGLVPRLQRLPWVPTEEEWTRLVASARQEPLRNRILWALQYEGALRRGELVGLCVADIDPAHRTIRIRAEITKGRVHERVVTYSATTGRLYAAYLQERWRIDPTPGPLFLSDSNRNRAGPISASAWDKVIRRVRERAGVPRYTTHTPRHLCLTDLARAGWSLYELAAYAGHKNPHTTMIYVHLSGRDLVHRFVRCMERQEERLRLLAESLS